VSEPRGLLVTKEFSPAPTSGGMLRTLALAEELARDRALTVVSPDGVWRLAPGEPLSELPSAQDEGAAWRALWTAPRYRSVSGVRTAGARLLANLRRGAGGQYDVGVLDHTCLAGLAGWIATGCDRLAVSMHNVESDLMAQRAAASFGPARWAMTAEVALLHRLERQVAARYPVVVCTEADAAAVGGDPVIVCRNGVFERPRPPGVTPDRDVVFSGALDWAPNVEGVRWFADEVWPRVRARRPDASATVAGRHPGPDVRGACQVPGLTLLPDPPSMADVLARHRVGAVPLLTGGGSRIKILEYLAAGLGAVSTDLGASGLEDVPAEFLVRTAAEPQALADALVERLDAGEEGAGAGRAERWVREHYSWSVTVRPLRDFLRG
jgi:hypothetical protein